MRGLLVLAIALAVAGGPFSPVHAQPWELAEMQPDIPNGGRANTIAVNPADTDLILVASESGGLFRSMNRGATWSHVDSLPQHGPVAVTFLPADPNIALATIGADYRVVNGGGVWRSTDRGLSWTQVHSPPSPSGGADRFTAFAISVAPDTGAIYVASVFGVSVSTDRGLSWRLSDPFGGSGHVVVSVLAQRGGIVLAGGPDGLRRSVDGGASWTGPSTQLASVSDVHALGGSPLDPEHAFLVDSSTNLFATEDGGDHWTSIPAAPGGGGNCGGIAFVKAVARRRLMRNSGLYLYFSNRCGVSRLAAPPRAGTDRLDLTGTWTPLTVDHADPRDLGFSARGDPILLATDGGLHKTADGGASWRFAGGGRAGYNALQITEIVSQQIGTAVPDLYFATQDNDVWASSDFGMSWPVQICCEGFFLELERRVPSAADSQITFVACSACVRYRSDRLLAQARPWPSPPELTGVAKFVGRSFHVQSTDESPRFRKGLAYTLDLGATWRQYAAFPEAPRALPKQSRRRVGWFDDAIVLYQPVNVGWDPTRNIEINHFVRTEQIPPGNAAATYPRMNNFGGLGINPTMFAWYPVFAVDPENPNHLIAPDVIREEMKETWDGGDNWTDRADLTALFTDRGAFRFTNGIFPLVTAISFSRDDPRYVAAGTMQAGLFLSSDGGVTWSRVAGSERVTYVTSLEWTSSHQLLVSTYGRGLWNVSRMVQAPRDWAFCIWPCGWRFVDPLSDPPPERFVQGFMVLGGRIEGSRLSGGRLVELFVSPGSKVVWRSDSPPPAVKVRTARRWVGLAGTRRVKRLVKRRETIVGIALDVRHRVVGLAAAPRPVGLDSRQPLASLGPSNRDRSVKADPVGIARSPTLGKPYVEIRGGGPANRVTLGAPLPIEARGLPRGATVAIAIDDRLFRRVTVSATGRLAAQMTAPNREGLHILTVRDHSGAVLTGLMFLVVHEDADEQGEYRQERFRH